ncbi:hypothetical protein ACFWXB_13860 [Tsukamurella tyrosinosolvens]|uniref:hypothetical protein n=1 Tax=Tsukamurella tyrosinosolvens TaxID=57704 RepID=UPI002DD43FE9|nr:hypothetical protein [Tsukamurella tyrosinosolvens]MEC4612884.1 hypothetical protein [Tsukamurella tyrosinosolvens]
MSGPWVSITSGDYPRDDAGWAYGPMPAPGITAYQRDSNGELDGCTISFPVIDSQGTVAFLSAGHCDQRTGERLSMITTPDGSGSIELGDYQQSVDDQTVLARETPIPGAAARDYTVLTMGDQLYRGYRTEIARGVRLRGVMNTDTVRALPKGTMLCKNGAHTGVTCGPLVSADARTATFAVRAIKGDSGAPIFVVNSAGEALGVGILSGFDAAGNTVVAYLSPALSQLGLRAVLSE